MNTIYTITAFEKLPTKENLSIGDHRCFRFFYDRNEAENVLRENIGDIFETIYNYGVVETYTPGISVTSEDAKFFKYDRATNKYVDFESNDVLNRLCNFAIG